MKILMCLPINEEMKQRFTVGARQHEVYYATLDRVNQQMVNEADIIFGNVPPEYLASCSHLKWLQLNTAGADRYCHSNILPAGVILTNAIGAYGTAVSEHMLAGLLMVQKKLHLYYRNQLQRVWQSMGATQGIEGSTVLVIGLGDIGGSFAKKLKGLGSYVIGVRRKVVEQASYLDEQYTMEQLDQLIPRADIIAVILPETKETTNFVNEKFLSLMKETAILINAGRGTVVNTEALYQKLKENSILGAVLDVVDPEPLPSDHPLWELENVLITPHVAGGFWLPGTVDKIFEIYLTNLKRFMNQQPLINQTEVL